MTAANSHGSTGATSSPTPLVERSAAGEQCAARHLGQSNAGPAALRLERLLERTPRTFSPITGCRCDSGGACSSITGASAGTYSLVLADVGATIRVVVTAANPYGSASAISAATTAIGGLSPFATTPPSISGTAMQGQTLLVTNERHLDQPAERLQRLQLSVAAL